MSDDYCGFEIEGRKIPSIEDDDVWKCEREVGDDEERCIWHRRPSKKDDASIETSLATSEGPFYGADFSGMELHKIDFSSISLIGADFYGCDIRDCTFDSADLTYGTFDGATIRDTKFTNCDFSNTSFNGRDTVLEDCTFSGGIQVGLEFKNTGFIQTDIIDFTIKDGSLRNSDFKGGRIKNLDIIGGSATLLSFRHTDISHLTANNTKTREFEIRSGVANGVQFQSVKPESSITISRVSELGIEITGQRIKQVSLTGCENSTIDIQVSYISDLDLTEIDGLEFDIQSRNIESLDVSNTLMKKLDWRIKGISNIRLDDVKAVDRSRIDGLVVDSGEVSKLVIPGGVLSDCHFNGVYFEDLDVSGGEMTESRFEGGSLHNSVLNNAELSDCCFNRTKMANAQMRELGIGEDVNFNRIDATSSDFSSTDLSELDLRQINFEKSNLHNVNLRDSDLRGSHLFDSTLDSIRINRNTELGRLCHYEYNSDRAAEGLVLEEEYDVEDLKAEFSFLGFPIPHPKKTIKRLWNRGLGDKDWRKENAESLKSSARVYRAYQQLLRENSLPGDVRHYRIREKEARRKCAYVERDWGAWIRLSALRWSIQYGERYRNVLSNSLLVILIWSILYLQTGGVRRTISDGEVIHRRSYNIIEPISNMVSQVLPISTDYTIELFTALYFSIVTFTTLGYGDLQPASDTVRMLAALQSLIGTALTAVLVFILARRATW